jgi:hypothetical protein
MVDYLQNKLEIVGQSFYVTKQYMNGNKIK